MEKGSWNYRGYVVIIVPYDGYTKLSHIMLDTLELWVQIHDLSDGYAPLLKALAGKVGEVVPKSHDFEETSIW